MRSADRGFKSALFCLILLMNSIAGCAYVYVPSTRLETPETVGRGRLGRLQVFGVQSGPNLVSAAVTQATNATTGVTPAPVLQNAVLQPFLNFEFGLEDEWDLGVRLQPYGPLSFRVRRQWVGLPEARAQKGLSVATSVTLGGLLGRVGSDSFFLYQADFGLPAGYRLGKGHVLAVVPFLGLGGVSGGTLGRSVVQYGAHLDHHWEFGSVVVSSELGYAWGVSGSDQISSIQWGAALGFSL